MEIYDISEDIICEILLRIPAEMLITVKAVCKLWCKLISDPKFVYAHLTYQREDFSQILVYENKVEFQQELREYKLIRLREDVLQAPPNFELGHRQLQYILKDEIYITSSCNGLLLFESRTNKKQLYLCNPVTRKCTILPVHNPDDEYQILNWVLVYDTSIQRYKVVGFQESHRLLLFTPQSHHTNNEGKLEKTTAVHWRQLVTPQYETSYFSKPIAINKELHWLSKVFDSTEVVFIMVSLDVSKEEFGETKVPFLTGINWDRNKIMEVMGYVCVSVYLTEQKQQLDIWRLQDRKKGLWTKKYSIMCKFDWDVRVPFFFSHPSSTSSDQTNIVAYHRKKVFVYDLKNKQWKRIDFPVQKHTHFVYGKCVHTNSLVHWE